LGKTAFRQVDKFLKRSRKAKQWLSKWE